MVLRAIFAPVFGPRTARRPGIKVVRNPDLVPSDLDFDEAMRRLSTGRKVVTASNRGPLEFLVVEDGGLQARRGSGGVATILGELARSAPFTWVVSPMSEADRLACKGCQQGRVRAPFNGGEVELRFVQTPQEVYDRYYSAFSNPLLWFMHHYMWDLAHGTSINAAVYDAWEHGYIPVNQAYADAIVQELDSVGEAPAPHGRRPVVLFQDYHLYLAPGFVRERVPEAVLQHFIHVPWPGPRYWHMLPAAMRLPIIRSLCQNDIVGFQTKRDLQSFLSTCETFLPDAAIDVNSQSVHWLDRTVYARSYPVSIDVAAVQEAAASAEADGYRERLERLRGEHTIVRVDRLEPTKNIVRGFLAFDGLLGRYPELAGRIKFWAFLVPSRTDLKAYKEYKKEIFGLVEQINERHGTDAWRPIEVFYENNYVQALAGMSLYDVLLVNPVMDGMNLVAKEGPTVNRRDGVLVMSEGAGTHEQLGRHALSVTATDVEGTIRALHEALTMASAERRYRAERLREAVETADLRVWIHEQVKDLLGVLGR